MFKNSLSIFKRDELNKVKRFLNKAKNISIGYREIIFLEVHDFEKGQVGYKFDQKGNQLNDLTEGGWDDKWFVIGTDDLGDPIFLDTSDYYLPVYTAVHGNGDWEPISLAISLEDFDKIINKIRKLSINREDPDLIESNPISETQFNRIIKSIKRNNPEVEIEWWETFLTHDLED